MEQQKEGIRQEFMLLNWYLKEHLASAVRIAAFIGVFSLLCLVFARYDLDALIRQAVRKYAPLFIRRKIILSYEPVHCEVLTDEKWLVFVLEQILSNALKYTKSGSIHIYLSPDAPKTLVIEDTGIGIAPEDLPRIFEKGYTGCNGRADKRSTGIGLYLCRQIMEKLSHTIRIESEMGVGTKVYLGLDTVSL